MPRDEIVEFFGVGLATTLRSKRAPADLMIANNVLAHVPDINDFVGGFAILLKPEGVATFEFPHLLRMVEGRQFDTAYHEHYSYLSLTAVHRIFAANGLRVFDVEELSTHGGSLRVLATRSDSVHHPVAPRVQATLEMERAAGMMAPAFYSAFQKNSERIKNDLVAYLIKAKQAGLRVAAYGAAAKGNTLMNFAGIRSDLVSYVVDRNPAKQGKFMPGSRIPILSEAHLKEDKPDLVLILPWNLQTELAGS